MIKLNVGGTKFDTTLETIKKIPFINNMIDDCGIQDEVFINRSGMIY